jgi:hypothetical protein
VAPAAERAARLSAIGSTCYRLALHLYPQPFYQQYADDLEADFREASDERLAASGLGGLAAAWLSAFGDLPVSLAREWLRTPWPPVLLAAATIAGFVLYSSVFRAYGPLEHYRRRVAAGGPPPADSPQLLILMALMVLVPVAGIVAVAAIINFTMRRPRGGGRRV